MLSYINSVFLNHIPLFENFHWLPLKIIKFLYLAFKESQNIALIFLLYYSYEGNHVIEELEGTQGIINYTLF